MSKYHTHTEVSPYKEIVEALFVAILILFSDWIETASTSQFIDLCTKEPVQVVNYPFNKIL